MTDPRQERKANALALQREIQDTRVQLVADIGELQDVVRVRLSVRHILQTHPEILRGLSVALGIAGVATIALLWRATKRARQAAS